MSEELILKRAAVKRMLEKLQGEVIEKMEQGILDDLLQLETVIYLMVVYLEHLDCTIKDVNYLNRKKIKLDINDMILDELNLDYKLQVMCIVKGECGI